MHLFPKISNTSYSLIIKDIRDSLELYTEQVILKKAYCLITL